MFDAIRNLFGGGDSASETPPVRPAPPPEPEPDEVAVPEISASEVQAAAAAGSAPLVLDIREVYEWNLTRVKPVNGINVLHIPMNMIPNRLDDLPRDQEIAVLCAAGGRSYGVAHYLIEQGFNAKNVTGGISRWAQGGGTVEQGKASNQ